MVLAAAAAAASVLVAPAGPGALRPEAFAQPAPAPTPTPRTQGSSPPATKLPREPRPVSTPQAPVLALRDVLALALRDNRTLASQGLDVEIAEADVLAAAGVDDPVLAVDGTAVSRRAAPVEGQSYTIPRSDDVRVGGGLTVPLSSGGRAGVRFDAAYRKEVSRIAIMGQELEMTSELWVPGATLSLWQPLLRGRGERVARAGRRRAVVARDLAQLARMDVTAAVVRDVVQAYWDLAYATQEVAIRRNAVALAQEQLRVTRARVEAGAGAPTDLAAVEQGIASREEELLLAEQVAAERALHIRQLTGLPIAADQILVHAADPLEAEPEVRTVEEALEAALAHNPQLATVRARGELATIDVEVTENGLLPQLDVAASAGPVGVADEPGAALERLVGFDDYSVRADLTFSLPIGRRTARGQVAAARGRLQKVRVGARDLEAQVAVAAIRGVNQVRSTLKRLEVLATSVRLAQVNLDAETARFQVGRTTNFEILRRQDELAQSQLRHARATADYLKAVAALDALTGTILAKHGVRVR